MKKVEENGRRLDYRREKRMGEGWIIEGRRELEKVGLKKVEKDVLDLERRGRKELFKRGRIELKVQLQNCLPLTK